jgi:UDP-N-acetylmuramyl pentapeptide phosphotransferase/UDP-N-acetylglucosamine-1-phosphate transferase
MAIFYAPLIALVTTLLAVGWLVRRGSFALDYPSHRSLHQAPVPRTGGLGLHAGILLGALLVPTDVPIALVAGVITLVGVSFVEDLRGIPALWRLVLHLLSAALVAGAVVFDAYGLAAVIAVAFALAWMTNLYNFMDGSDGLAGGMTLFGFAFYGSAAWLAGAMPFSVLNFSIAAAAAGFLVYNFHPARIFLGDVGSVPLGFAAGSLGLLGVIREYWPWWFPLLVFSPFIVDASTTLARRAFQRERVWEPHRDHYYQRLVQLGWGHRRTALAEYATMGVCGGLALYSLGSAPNVQQTIFTLVGVAYAVVIGVIEYAWRTLEPHRGSRS